MSYIFSSGLSGFGSIKIGELLISCTLGIGTALILDQQNKMMEELKDEIKRLNKYFQNEQ